MLAGVHHVIDSHGELPRPAATAWTCPVFQYSSGMEGLHCVWVKTAHRLTCWKENSSYAVKCMCYDK